MKILILIFIVFSFNYLFQACGGTRPEADDGLTEEERQQKEELDEIESLLGITQEKDDSQQQPAGDKKSDETLGLLDSDEALVQTQPIVPPEKQITQPVQPPVDNEKIKQMEREISDLQNQISEKDLIISDLRAQLSFQSEQLSANPPSYSSSSSGYSPSGYTASDVSMDYQGNYDRALELFHSRDYHSAIEAFESLLATSANNSLSDNAQYWIGESHYALGQYDKAIIDFEKVFTFPKSNKDDDAQYKLGLCYMKKGDNVKAREEFQRLIDLYPKSEYISRAREKLNSL